jgi:hypothetical protein
MEFTLNVNLNLSEATERTLNRLADAFGNSQNVAPKSRVGLRPMAADEEAALKAKIAQEVIDRLDKDQAEMEAEAAKPEVVEETPKTTRTRKPVAPKVVEETVVEETKPEAVEKGTGDFVPAAVAIRALAIPLAKAGHGVKEKLTELGYGGIGQLSEGGNEEHIQTFYAWLLEETKSLK